MNDDGPWGAYLLECVKTNQPIAAMVTLVKGRIVPETKTKKEQTDGK